MTAETKERFVPQDSLANRLFLVRRSFGLSHREAELRTGVGRGSWQSWESGRSPRDELRKLTQVADALGIDRDWLLFGGQLRAQEWAARDSNPEPMDSQPAAVSTADLKAEYLRDIQGLAERHANKHPGRNGRPRAIAGAA